MISLEIKKAKLAISIRVEQLKMKTCETEYEDKKQIAQQAQVNWKCKTGFIAHLVSFNTENKMEILASSVKFLI